MYIGNPLPKDWAYTLGGSGGQALAAGSSWDYLHDRQTGPAASFTFCTGSQNTSKNVTITGVRSSTFIPKIGMMVSMKGVPVGTKVTVAGKNGATNVALGGNALTLRTVLLPDGSVGLKWLFGSPTAIDTEVYTIYNDVNGVASIAAGQAMSIGEANICSAEYMQHELGWKRNRPSTQKIVRALGGTAYYNQAGTNWGLLNVRPIQGDINQARNGGLANSSDMEKITASLAADPFCMVYEQTDTDQIMQRSGMLAVATKIPDLTNLAGNYFQFDSFTFEEIPNI